MFEYSKQPLKTVYLVYVGCKTLFVSLPRWVLVSAVPGLRPRRAWGMRRVIGVGLLRTVTETLFVVGFPAGPDPAKDAADGGESGFAWVDGVADDMVRGEVAEMAAANGVRPARVFGYWYGRRGAGGAVGQRAAAGERVLYFLHGGGYVFGSASPAATVGWGGAVQATLDSCGLARAFGLEYRVSSSAPHAAANAFPAALLDALAGYQYLVATGFRAEDIIVCGNSAGGHLAVALVRYLASAHIAGLGVPRGALLFSPTADWRYTPGHPNVRSDYVDAIVQSGYTARSLRGALPAHHIATDPYLSPASTDIAHPSGLFRAFPPTCIVAGGAEQTLDPMLILRDRIVADNGEDKVEFLLYADATHDFVNMDWHEPERSAAYKAVARWVRSLD